MGSEVCTHGKDKLQNPNFKIQLKFKPQASRCKLEAVVALERAARGEKFIAALDRLFMLFWRDGLKGRDEQHSQNHQ